MVTAKNKKNNMGTFTHLLQATVIVGLILATLLLQTWPRHPDGSLYSIEEMARLMEMRQLREPPRLQAAAFWSGVVVFIACLMYALGPRGITQ